MNDNTRAALYYFFLPLLGVYVVDYIVALGWLIQLTLMGVCATSVIAVIAGVVFSLLDIDKNQDQYRYESILKFNIAKQLPLLRVGYKLGTWALQDDSDAE